MFNLKLHTFFFKIHQKAYYLLKVYKFLVYYTHLNENKIIV